MGTDIDGAHVCWGVSSNMREAWREIEVKQISLIGECDVFKAMFSGWIGESPSTT